MSTFTPERSERCRAQPSVMPPTPEVPFPAINTDVRWRGFNPFFTGVTLGIVAFITGFLLLFAHLVVTYLQYADG